MKKITIICLVTCALMSNDNAFGMLFKQATYTKKYIKNVHTRKPNAITHIKRILLNHQRDTQEALENDESTIYDAEDQLRDLYFRNNTIIYLLHQNKNGIKAKKILKEQQDMAVRGLGYEDEIDRLEKQLYKSLKIKKIE